MAQYHVIWNTVENLGCIDEGDETPSFESGLEIGDVVALSTFDKSKAEAELKRLQAPAS